MHLLPVVCIVVVVVLVPLSVASRDDRGRDSKDRDDRHHGRVDRDRDDRGRNSRDRDDRYSRDCYHNCKAALKEKWERVKPDCWIKTRYCKPIRCGNNCKNKCKAQVKRKTMRCMRGNGKATIKWVKRCVCSGR